MTGTEIALPENPGPLMEALTENQQRFVLALVASNDPSNETAAARAAGYAAPAVSAHALMRNRKVLAAIREEADKRQGASALIAIKGLIEIASDRAHKQRFQACVELANRAGLQVIAKQEIVVKDDRIQNLPVDELMRELRESAKRLGLVKPEDFAQTMIEGEFVEVATGSREASTETTINDSVGFDEFAFIIQPGEFT